jgi:hypothetical protein
MKPRTFKIYGFEGKGGKYLVVETHSASEARDLRLARVCSEFQTAVYSADVEITEEELDRLADIEIRFR